LEPPPKVSRAVTTTDPISEDAGVRDPATGADRGFRLTNRRGLAAARIWSPPLTNMNAYDNRPGNARVAHGITLRLNKFGWESLESEAHRDDETLDDLLSRAAAYLDAELPTRRAAMLAPRFRPRGRGMPREIRFEVSRDCWQRLESEARRQGVSLERLLEHAAMVYLADIDSGRVANRLLGDAGEGDPL
jgi:predicted DNA-binding ribbon-helix-helix protein